MKTPNLPASLWLLATGAGLVLLIGAFARFDSSMAPLPPVINARDALKFTAASSEPEAPPMPGTLSAGLFDIVKLAQSHVDEDVMLTFITNSGQVYSPTADEILYLNQLGVSQKVITALINTKAVAKPVAPMPSSQLASVSPSADGALPPVEPASAQQESPAVTELQAPPDYAGAFYEDLAPYGTWSQQPDYGICWQPVEAATNPDWRPYVDSGQWLYSDEGWYWHSYYSWGWAPFHYGRWVNSPKSGWVWTPGNQWSPAWVVWKSASQFVGWAPLPPGVSLNVLAQLAYGTHRLGPNPSFGLTASSYAFVNASDLLRANVQRRVLPAPKIGSLVKSATLLTNYGTVGKHFVNGGVSPRLVAAAARKNVTTVKLIAAISPESAGTDAKIGVVSVYRPIISASPPASKSTGDARSRPSTDTTALADNYAAGNSEAAPFAPDPSRIQLPPLRLPATPAPPVFGYAPLDRGNALPRQLRPNYEARSGFEPPPGYAPRFGNDPRSGYEPRSFYQGQMQAMGSSAPERSANPAPRFDEPAHVSHEAPPREQAPEHHAEEPAHASPPASSSPSSSSSSSSSSSHSGK